MQIPNMDKPVTREKCDAILYNLLRIADRQFAAPTFIRELWQTKRCGQYFGNHVATLRDDYVEHLGNGSPSRGEERLRRILEFQEDAADIKQAELVTLHYRQHTRRVLSENMTWSGWAKYVLIDTPEDLALRLLRGGR